MNDDTPELQDETTGFYPVPGFPALRLKLTAHGTVTPPAPLTPPLADHKE